MTDKIDDKLALDDSDLDDLSRRMVMAENRLNAVRSHRLMRQQESLALLTKIEERFVQQRNDLLHAQDHIRRLERMNRDLVGKLSRIVSAVEAGMDAADDIFYRMVNVTNEIANFSNQSLTGEYHAHAMLDGLDIDDADGRAGRAGGDAGDQAPAPVLAEVEPPFAAPGAASAGLATRVVRRPSLTVEPTPQGHAKDSGAQVLDIKAIFSKG